ncbi:hypothetical protein HK098_006908 [Nowakowskiella sp. JEL0407]|nr:hypothetical protein HK098_006908 [Nowakowskiella sp. JEL0407]
MTPTIANLFPHPVKSVSILDQHITYEDSLSPSETAATPKRIMVCVPGLGDFRQQFRFLAPKLLEAGNRVICADLRGTGGCSTGFKSFSCEDVAGDIIAILDNEKITTPVVFIGNSFAAAVAVLIAANHPERIEKIITLGGFFRPTPADKYFIPLTYVLFTSMWGAASWTGYFQTLFKDSPPADLSEYIAYSKFHFNEDTKRIGAIAGFCRANKGDSWKSVLKTKCDVLLIMGTSDPDFSDPKTETEEVAAEFRKREEGLVVETFYVEGVGHYPHVENPVAVYDAIIKFL